MPRMKTLLFASVLALTVSGAAARLVRSAAARGI